VSSRAALVAALGLLAAIALGWGLPGAGTQAGSRSPTSHAVRVTETATDAIVAVAAPVAEAVAARLHHGTTHERVRDALGMTAGAVALLLLLAHRRRRTIAVPQSLRAAVVAHGGRAPPV
jgi:hypothetical protein